MKIGRIVASISASYDQFITKMENHEAVADGVIGDIQEAAAHVRSEKGLVEQRRRRLQEERKKLEKEVVSWRRRAKACVEEDEGRALSCLKQAKLIERRLETLYSQEADIQQLEAKLVDYLRDVEEKLHELQARKVTLASRQARSQVVSGVDNKCGKFGSEAVFDRWEKEIVCSEYMHLPAMSDYSDSDYDNTLAREFEAEEEQAALRDELSLLRAEIKAGEGKEDE